MTKPGYDSDLTDAQWAHLSPLLPPPGRGRPRQHEVRVLINAILYVLRTGCQWRLLPHDFPPWSTVYHHFRKWRDDDTWEPVMQALRQQVRVHSDRAPQPSAVIIDSQSIKTTEKGGLGATMGVSG
jgi:putative transposase